MEIFSFTKFDIIGLKYNQRDTMGKKDSLQKEFDRLMEKLRFIHNLLKNNILKEQELIINKLEKEK